MPSPNSPVFRKEVIPWHRSTTAGIVIMVAMLGTFLFGLAGLGVTQEVEPYRPYAWVPVLLMVMSAFLLVTTAVRLLRRYAARSRQNGI